MDAYLNLLERVLIDGIKDTETRGQPTIQSFGESITVDLKEGLPILTTKEIRLKNIIGEMLWFISGKNTINDLKENNINFWEDWADNEGRVESYGRYWRYLPLSNHEPVNDPDEPGDVWVDGKPYLGRNSEFVTMDKDGKPYFDQLAYVYQTLKRNPGSRRIKLDQWVSQNAFASSLPPCPCHLVFNTHPRPYGEDERVLNLHVWQRSADVPIGVPYNLAVYGCFLMCLAIDLHFVPGKLKFSFTNAHIYKDQVDKAYNQLSRIPRSRPMFRAIPDGTVLSWGMENIDDFSIAGYNPLPSIKYPVQT